MPKQNVPNSSLKNGNNPKTIARYLAHVRGPNPARFRVGDNVTFVKMDDQNWPLLILDIRGNDFDVVCYDGNPHLVRLTMADLNALRVIRIEECGCEAVDMYRALVGLDIEGEVAA
ncbi:hypothetical protein MNR02_08795 [Shinella sp. H4-D48]|uniref:hypothetical protein n=1 Tax=Shinella sp. H4-D48 TaxID=2925841 RepID=UPI001F52B9F7|nr:hypothetical protein [Shinella sp. H4-D48]UNK36611.1 hypothetical protein MNR02_08795 [Shinella sp. H4-D48]